MRLLDKQKAINLRCQGYTYNEIIKHIPDLSTGTLSGWIKTITLTESQKKRIIDKTLSASKRGQLKGAWANKLKALQRIEKLSKEADSQFQQLANNPLFLVGLSLYWAEGFKKGRRFEFINSDPDIIRIIMRWLREIFDIPEDMISARIFMHKIYENENCREFWSKVTGLSVTSFRKTVYKPTPHKIKRNLAYKGCCRISIKGSELFWKIQAWQKLLVKI